MIEALMTPTTKLSARWWAGWLAPIVFIVACATDDPAAPTPIDAVDAGPGGQPVSCGRGQTLCVDGAACEGAPDCTSGVCRSGTCRAVVPSDGTKNNDETDVDCGGASAPACDDGKACGVGDDCKSGVCTGSVCQPPSAGDGIKNGDETGKDCGGAAPTTPRCGAGEGCNATSDCLDAKCDEATKKCLPASHGDGIENLDETDVDCGGSAPLKCEVGKKCSATSDCNKVKCNAGTHVCDPPSKNDGIKNGTETDVDCGGGAPTNASPCAEDLLCKTHTDCASKGCDDRGRCAGGKSCTQKLGGRTCGPGEVVNGEPAAGHESCCERAPLVAGGLKKIDKYLITAGRMRQFITREQGKIRTWVSGAAIPGWQTMAWAGLVPNSIAEANVQLGAYWVGAPNDADGGQSKRSCDADYSGGHTYWTNNAQETPSDYTQAESDVKALNCVGWHLLRAFCAWEGGRLATRGEIIQAYKNNGTTAYPWGNTFASSRLDHQFNYSFPIKANARTRPDGAGGTYLVDIAVFVAPPGRFPTGANKLGVQDMAGDLLEWSNDAAYQFNWTHSWENHTDDNNKLSAGDWQVSWPKEPNGYYAIGGRCAY
jgi:formylglycine-generating enzyme required for sulfatase activity